MTLAERFWEKVDKSGGSNTCWGWLAFRMPRGYGRFGVDGVVKYAHRIAWELTFGKIPEGLHVLHICDNPPCMNPAHLFLGTQKDNVQDMTNKGRRVSTYAESNGHAKLNWSKVGDIRHRYALGNITQIELANEFDISQGQISIIVRNKIWKIA